MKKKTILFILINFLLFHLRIVGQTLLDPQAVIEQYLNMREAHTSVSYNIRFYHKSFNWEDTTLYKAKVNLVRIPGDSIFHGLVSMDLDSVWYGYNGTLIYRADKEASLLEYDSVSVNPGAFILSNYVYNLIDDGF